MDHRQNSAISSKMHEESPKYIQHRLKNIQSSVEEAVRDDFVIKKLKFVTEDSTDDIHRFRRQNLNPLSLVNGFVQQTIGTQLKPFLGVQMQPVRHQNIRPQSEISLQQTYDSNSFSAVQSNQNLQMMPQYQANLDSSFVPTGQLSQGPYQIPSIQHNPGSLLYNKASGILNLGSQLASSIQHIVNTHLESTVQRNIATHLASSNQNNFQPQPYCPNCAYPIKPNTEFVHQVQAGPPQISVVSETRFEVICSGDNRDCNDIPSKLHHATTDTIQHGYESTPATPAKFFSDKPSTGELVEGEDSKGIVRPDIVYADTSNDQPKLIETSGHDDIDIRIGSDNTEDRIVNTRLSKR